MQMPWFQGFRTQSMTIESPVGMRSGTNPMPTMSLGWVLLSHRRLLRTISNETIIDRPKRLRGQNGRTRATPLVAVRREHRGKNSCGCAHCDKGNTTERSTVVPSSRSGLYHCASPSQSSGAKQASSDRGREVRQTILSVRCDGNKLEHV